MKYGWKFKLDCVPKHKEGKRDFAPAARRKNFFESIVATAKGSKAKQNGYPLQIRGTLSGLGRPTGEELIAKQVFQSASQVQLV